MKCATNTFMFLVFFVCTICVGQTVNAQIVYRSMPVAANASLEVYPYVIARPADRTWIRQMPIEYRPNRPMHFWGNNVRRRADVPASRVVIRNRNFGGLILRR